jgi:hypothetical protein
MKKELEELCKKHGFELAVVSFTDNNLMSYEIRERRPLFTNTIGEKFYGNECELWYFGKISKKVNCVSCLKTSDMGETEGVSEVYKTKETAEEQLELYIESLKPKYRPFNMDEADEYLGLKLERKDKRVYKILYKVSTVDALNEYFRNWVKLDGSPVGKQI